MTRATACGLLMVALVLDGCSPAYVLRAGYEEACILWRREPIERVLARTDLDASTRSKLELVLAVRRFAQERLALRVDGSYASLAHVDADQTVHVVTGAYRLRLQSYTWWFPIVGRVPYKGYFSEAAAQAEAAGLRERGYDANVRDSVAFSTLGWFADPLLSSLLRYDRVTLAEVIIHELLHNTTYLAGHADFDESFANFVGRRGAIAFFAERQEEAALIQATDAWEDTLQFSAFLVDFTARLRAAYAAGISLDERGRLFSAAQEQFRSLPRRSEYHRDFGTESLNNAVILEDLAYNDRLQVFEDLFQQSGSDLRTTIANVIVAVAGGSGDPFATVQGLVRATVPVTARRALSVLQGERPEA